MTNNEFCKDDRGMTTIYGFPVTFIVFTEVTSVWFRPFTYWQVVAIIVSGFSVNSSHWSHLYYIVTVQFGQLLFPFTVKQWTTIRLSAGPENIDSNCNTLIYSNKTNV